MKAKPATVESNLDGDPEMYRAHGIVYRVTEKPVSVSARVNRWDKLTTACSHELRTDRGVFTVPSSQAAHDTVKQLAKCQHKGVKHYAHEARNRKYPAAGPANLRPCNDAQRRFPGYRFFDDDNDWIVEHRDLRAAVIAADTYCAPRVAVTAEVYGVAVAKLATGRVVRAWRIHDDKLAPCELHATRDDGGDHWLQFVWGETDRPIVRPELIWAKVGGEYHSAWPDGEPIVMAKHGSKWGLSRQSHRYVDPTYLSFRESTLRGAQHKAAEAWARSILDAKNDEARDSFDLTWKGEAA